MSNVFASVLRLTIVMAGFILLFVSKFEGWLAGIGVMVLAIGAGWIITVSRQSAREAREEEEARRFDHIRFQDEDKNGPKGPWES